MVAWKSGHVWSQRREGSRAVWWTKQTGEQRDERCGSPEVTGYESGLSSGIQNRLHAHFPDIIYFLLVPQESSPPNDALAIRAGSTWAYLCDLVFDIPYGRRARDLNSKGMRICGELDSEVDFRHEQI